MSRTESTPTLLDPQLSDEKWLGKLDWRKGAPASLVGASRKGNIDGFAAALKEQNSLSAKRQLKLTELLQGLHLNDSHNGILVRTFLGLTSSTADDLESELTQALELHGLNPAPPLEVIAGLTFLLVAPNRLSQATHVSLWRWCVVQCCHWIEEQPTEGEPETLSDLLSVAELPLLAGQMFPHLKQSKKWISKGRKGWNQWCTETTDSDGTLDAQWLDRMLPVLQSLGRSETYLQDASESLLSAKLTGSMEGLVKRCLCLATPGRLATLSSASSGTLTEFKSALAALGYKKTHPIRRLLALYADPQSRGQRLGVRTWDLPEQFHQSDWAEWACLRTSWDADLDQVLVNYGDAQTVLDIVLNGLSVFSGSWTSQLQLDGVPWEPSEWSCSCVFHDDDADYVELQQVDDDKGVTITRQILLNRANRGLFLADIIKTNQPGELSYRWELPFSSDVIPNAGSQNGHPHAAEPRFEFDALTREAAAQFEDLRVRLFPLGWPQDRFAPAPGKMQLDRQGLAMEVRVTGDGLCLPLFLDWHPPRRDTPCDWSLLTVAEDGQVIDRSQALGSRLRLGREQWLYFYNIRPGALPRTVLGHHTLYETVIARVKRGGEIVPLVQVDQEQVE